MLYLSKVKVLLSEIIYSRRGFFSTGLFCASSSRILKHLLASGKTLAIVDDRKSYTYEDINNQSSKIANALSTVLEKSKNERVCFITGNDADYASTQVGIWKSGHVAVPLCKTHPASSLEYYINDCKAALIVTSRQYQDKVHQITSGRPILLVEDVLKDDCVASFQEADESCCAEEGRDAMILYTSGTTGPPKGVVMTHGNLDAATRGMEGAWGWSKKDSLLHVLPLHHTHGVVNCLLTPLTVGAKVVILPEFDAREVWKHLLGSSKHEFPALGSLAEVRQVNVFMAVPTVYAKLLEAHKTLFQTDEERVRVRECLRENIRLMVSGSAALPVPLSERWREVSGHVLLERFGMTEIGMALTNPLEPEKARMPGWVGKPFPEVEARIVSNGEIVYVANSGDCSTTIGTTELGGELEVRSPNVFREYFGRPSETKKEFTADGWFKTGDTVAVDGEGVFRILGRSSVDIIKSGGYKISALDIERVLLTHPSIEDVAVVGVEDPVWGQKVGAIVCLAENEHKKLSLESLREWSKDKMPAYHAPRLLKVMKELPRNNMGKVNKKELVKLAFGSSSV